MAKQTLEEAKAELQVALDSAKQHLAEGNWVMLHEAAKHAERVSFRIYMMTDSGE